VVEEALGKTTSSPKGPSNSMAKSAIIPFNANRIGFPDVMMVCREGGYEAIPFIICSNGIIGNS
jgi:hypothetical protein